VKLNWLNFRFNLPLSCLSQHSNHIAYKILKTLSLFSISHHSITFLSVFQSIFIMKISNNLIGILNFLTLLLSIPILLTGVWLHKQATSECERFLEKPIIILGVFLLIVSLLGFIGGCCRVTWLLWFYLFFMFLLIVVLFVFTIFAFVVTNKGAGESLSNKGYKEYRLGDYSNWLQKRVNDNGNWKRIKSCLQSGKLCTDFHSQFLNDTADKFYLQHLNALQVSFVLDVVLFARLLSKFELACDLCFWFYVLDVDCFSGLSSKNLTCLWFIFGVEILCMIDRFHPKKIRVWKKLYLTCPDLLQIEIFIYLFVFLGFKGMWKFMLQTV